MTDTNELSAHLIEVLRQGEFTNPRLTTLAERPGVYARFEAMAKKAGLETPALYLAERDLPLAIIVLPNDKIPVPAVVVSQSLLNLLNDREVAAILGHELGHFVHRSAHKSSEPGMSTFAGLCIGGATVTVISQILWDREQRKDKKTRREFMDHVMTSISIGAITAGLGGLIGNAVGNRRHFRMECEADTEAVNLSGDKEALISGLEKIANAWQFEKGDSNHRRIERLRCR